MQILAWALQFFATVLANMSITMPSLICSYSLPSLPTRRAREDTGIGIFGLWPSLSCHCYPGPHRSELILLVSPRGGKSGPPAKELWESRTFNKGMKSHLSIKVQHLKSFQGSSSVHLFWQNTLPVSFVARYSMIRQGMRPTIASGKHLL